MAENSTIEWTDASWTPIRARVREDAAAIAEAKGYSSLVQIASKMAGRVGPHCEHASPGCANCYSETNNGRCLPVNGTGLPFDRRSRDLVDVFVDEKILLQALKWRKPRKIFVCSQTDLFAEFVTDEMIDRVFAVMALCPQHTFQVLTKRANRMQDWADRPSIPDLIDLAISELNFQVRAEFQWPLPNVWLGVSVENQHYADERIHSLLRTPAEVRFVSYEPALGPVDFRRFLDGHEEHGVDLSRPAGSKVGCCTGWTPPLDLIIAGGESGSGARPMHPEWARSVRDQCLSAGVAFHFKQNGEFVSVSEVAGAGAHHTFPDGATVRRVGKKAAGRLLDGRAWDELPGGTRERG